MRKFLHPFLLAVFPVLFVFSHNIEQASWSDVWVPAALSLAATGLFMGLFVLTLKNTQKSALYTSLILFFFYTYGHVHQLGLTWHIGNLFFGRHRYLIIFWIISFIASFLVILRSRRNLDGITRGLNAAAGILVVMTVFNIVLHKSPIPSIPSSQLTSTALNNDSNLPDIYYIVLDGYANAGTLKDIYGNDNAAFLSYLSDKGFYIADKSTSNYAMTHPSLASTLNRTYINNLQDELGSDSKDQKKLEQMIQASEVARFLQARGYKYIHISSGLGATDRNPHADEEIRYGRINEFLMTLIKTTVLDPFRGEFFTEESRKRILNAFLVLATIPQKKEPTFTFAHILIPHPPFIFDKNGEPVRASALSLGGWVWTMKDAYLDQVLFANKLLQKTIDAIVSQSDPIIILQGDHGPASLLSVGLDDGWHNPTDAMLQERMRILNAYRFPTKSEGLYESITPVNSFNVLFKNYFDAEAHLLDDQNYFSNYDTPYRFTDVTDRVQYP